MKLPLILIGPMYVGKSTLGNLIAKKFSLPFVSVDEMSDSYYLAMGVEEEELKKKKNSDNFLDFINLVRPYEVKIAAQIVYEYSDSVISFGAGHSYTSDSKDMSLLMEIKASTPNIFLLLPSNESDKSRKILDERIDKDVEFSRELRESKKYLNIQFIESKSNREFAHHIIYTENKYPEDCVAEIIRLLA